MSSLCDVILSYTKIHKYIKLLQQAAAQHIWLSNDAQYAVTAGFAEKQLQVWKLDFGKRAADYGHVVSMKHPPVMVECRNNCKGEDGMVVLATSEKGVCYVWNFESITDEAAKPIRITVKASKGETDERVRRAKKNLVPVIAARLHALDRDAHLRALIAFGSAESPEFTSVDISSPGEDIVIAAGDQTKKEVSAVQENGHAKKGVVNSSLCFPVSLCENQDSFTEFCVTVSPFPSSICTPDWPGSAELHFLKLEFLS